MRAEGGRVGHLDRHLDRLVASAAAFGIPADRAALARRVQDAIASASGPLRVRLDLDPEGRVRVEARPLAARPFRTVWICPDALDEAGGPLCRHKTTRRDHYERPYRSALDRGADEAILLNAAGEVVEGTRTSVWIASGGKLWTPPLDAGGLPGVMRAHLLASRADTGEATLTRDDLEGADAVWVSNALRGLMPVRLLSLGA